jgi:hypothetical protein
MQKRFASCDYPPNHSASIPTSDWQKVKPDSAAENEQGTANQTPIKWLA